MVGLSKYTRVEGEGGKRGREEVHTCSLYPGSRSYGGPHIDLAGCGCKVRGPQQHASIQITVKRERRCAMVLSCGQLRSRS